VDHFREEGNSKYQGNHGGYKGNDRMALPSIQFNTLLPPVLGSPVRKYHHKDKEGKINKRIGNWNEGMQKRVCSPFSKDMDRKVGGNEIKAEN
jgi:hypothetical protein